MTETYWATLPPEKLCGEVMARWADWHRYVWQSGIGEKAAKGRRYYYGLNDLGQSSSKPNAAGNARQFLGMVINKIRPVVQRSLAMIAAQAPTETPVAANSDSAAREQAISAKGILGHVHREHDTENLDKEVLKIAMCMGEGWRLTVWDSTKGEETAVEDGPEGVPAPVEWAGDFRNEVLTGFDVARDPSVRDRRKLSWLIVRTFENKWELAAQFPEKADAILSAKEPVLQDAGSGYDSLGRDGLTKGDAVAVFHFFHVDGAAKRGGRAFQCLNEGTWLTDADNPYEGLPCEPCFADNIIGTTMGYTNVFDALGIADLLNAMESIVATHTVRYGLPPLIDYQGSGLQHSTLGNGTSVLTVKSKDHRPEPMEYPQLSPEVFKQLQHLAEQIYEMLGMNSTAMGEPPFSGMAAQAMALLDQKAREYNDGLAGSWATYKQGCATRELKILQKFATDERVALIQGKAKQWMLKKWSSDSLKHVSLVAMEPTPAGTGTMAWKWAMAEMLQKFGVQLPPEQLVELMRTGQYESPFEYKEANRLRIKAENEGLLEGRKPPTLIARTHWLDIPEHLALLSPPDITSKPEVVDAVLATVAEKLALWRSMPLDLLALMNGQPPPSNMPAPPPGAPGQGGMPRGPTPVQPVAPQALEG